MRLAVCGLCLVGILSISVAKPRAAEPETEWGSGEDNMHVFSNDELCELALEYYEKVNGLENSGLSVAAGDNEDGTVTIQIYESLSDHNSTAAWYQVDPRTGIGKNVITGDPIKIINGTPEISISFADPEQLQSLTSWEECIIDESEYHSDILLTAEVPIEDLSIVSIEWITGENEEEYGFRVEKEEFALDDFIPETPLLVSLTLPELIPNIGIQYVNHAGETKLYSICMSGLDGSPLLVEENLLK